MSRDIAVGVAGRIGSGKTTLASELASRLGCARASFGEYVRSIAQARGLDSTDRKVLQDLGGELISEGWTTFAQAVLDHAGYTTGPVVIDGIRHRAAIDTLRPLLSPTNLVLIAVDVSDEERQLRLQNRGLETSEIGSADAHANESEVDSVIQAADFVVPAHLTVDEASAAALRWLSPDGVVTGMAIARHA